MMRPLLLSLALSLLCSACGAKGPLERPSGPVPSPWFGAGPLPPADVSTPEKVEE